jgi:hypothetical protein
MQKMQQSTSRMSEYVGWCGVTLILIAYMGVTFGVLKPETLLYGCINLVGALGIIISSYTKRDFQPVVLNIIWLIVAVIGIIKSIA